MRGVDPIRRLFFVLAGACALTSLGGIGLLARMSPAIGQILSENERSVHEAERMLAVLALAPASDADRDAFAAALSSADANVTEPEEREILARLRAQGRRALEGEPAARQRAVRDLLQLSAVNRAAMRRADANARRIGLAGRWALALLGVLGIAGSAWALGRARRRVLAPMSELASVLEAHRAGDGHRRYTAELEGELSATFARVNDVLDDAARGRGVGAADEARLLRSALVRILDRAGGAVIVARPDGSVLAASAEAIARLAEEGERIRAAVREGTAEALPGELEVIEPDALVLLRLAPG